MAYWQDSTMTMNMTFIMIQTSWVKNKCSAHYLRFWEIYVHVTKSDLYNLSIHLETQFHSFRDKFSGFNKIFSSTFQLKHLPSRSRLFDIIQIKVNIVQTSPLIISVWWMFTCEELPGGSVDLSPLFHSVGRVRLRRFPVHTEARSLLHTIGGACKL